MSKKTALDLACEWISARQGCSDCIVSKEICERYEYSKCKDKIKQHFQQQADIPGGWDVVKDIRQMCINDQLFSYHGRSGYGTGYSDAQKDVINFINQRLKQARMKVE